MIGEVIGGIGTAIAGGLNYLGTHEANVMNRDIMREQMGFQERMSNTSYQRSVEDMRKAGINPMLAFMKGGASTPPGATAVVQNEFAGAVSSAIQLRQIHAEMARIKAETEYTRALTRGQENQNVSSKVRADIDNSLLGYSKGTLRAIGDEILGLRKPVNAIKSRG